MADIWQTTVSNAFSWMKIWVFRFECHWHLFTMPTRVPIMAWHQTSYIYNGNHADQWWPSLLVHSASVIQRIRKNGWVITSIIKRGMKLLIHSYTLTVQPLKFMRNAQLISSHTSLVIWLLTHSDIEFIIHVNKRRPCKIPSVPASKPEFNSLVPGRCGNDFKSVIIEHVLLIKFTSTCEIALSWIPQNTFDYKWTLVQYQATTWANVDPDWCHYIASQCVNYCHPGATSSWWLWVSRADSRLAPSQWETSLQCNAVSHWLGANLEWAQVSITASLWHWPCLI